MRRLRLRGLLEGQMHIRSSCCILAVLLTVPTSVRGQDWSTPVGRDSVLAGLVADALQRNPNLRRHAAMSRAATLRIRPAGAPPDPTLSLGMMDLQLPGFKFNSSDMTEIDFTVEQALPWPATLGARTHAAEARAAGARAEEAVARRELVGMLAAAYYRARYAVTALDILAEQRRLLDAAVQLSTMRYAVGVAPQTDPLQAKFARDRLASDAAALRGEHRAALAALSALRDRPATDTVPLARLEATGVRQSAQSLPTVDSLVALSLAAHPQLAARRADVEQAAAAVREERLGARPDVTVMARYGRRSAIGGPFPYKFPDFFSAGVGLRLPIWASQKQLPLADAARQDSNAAVAAYRDAEARLRRDVSEAAARADAARERLVLLVDGILPTARATAESALRSYEVGRSDFLTVLAVQDARYRAELDAAAVAAAYQAQLVLLQQLTEEKTP